MNNIQKYFNENIKDIIQISGGITNIVYKVITDKNTYILRIYGKKSNILIDRIIEKKIMNYLSIYHISPKIIKEYQECRIEEYFEGSTDNQPIKYQKKLCEIIKMIHKLPIKDNLPYFWKRFHVWKEQANDPYKKEINYLLEKINLIQCFYWNQEVLGHGDLTIGNILVNNNKIKLIDYEYSCILPRAFELANHLCEYGGLDSNNYTYPEKNIRISLIKEYIDKDFDYKEEYLKIIDYYSLISHYYWGCWSLIQEKISTIDFDYKKYGENRFNMFLHYHNIFMKT